ncbi:MAG: hypothetical protein JF606_05015 [Burkholderiales bacterium]|nr:hypothetical protein [Burkholderiales bacterium]
MTTPSSLRARPPEAGLDPLGGSAAVFRGRGAVTSPLRARPPEAGLGPLGRSAAGCSLALEAHCGVAPPRHSDGYDSSARLALRSDSGAINRHLRLDATLVPDLNAIDVDAVLRDAHQKEKSDA